MNLSGTVSAFNRVGNYQNSGANMGRAPEIRFAGESEPQSTSDTVNQAFHQSVRKNLDAHREVEAKRTILSKPVKPKRGLIRRSLFPLLTLGTVATTVAGGAGVYHYHSHQPRGEQIATEQTMHQNQRHVGSGWADFNQWTAKAQKEKTTYNHKTQTMLEFQKRSQEFLKQFIDTLSESQDPQDQMLAQKLNLANSQNNERINTVGLNLFTYINQHKTKGESLKVAQFVEQNDAFKHLSPRERENLAIEIYNIFNEAPNLNLDKFQQKEVEADRAASSRSSQHSPTPERRLRDVLDVYIGNPINGVSLDRFSQIQGKEEAKAFFESIVSNPNNFRQLSPEERTQFTQRGKEMLEVLDYQFIDPGMYYGIMAYTMLLAGAAGSSLTLRRVGKNMKASLFKSSDPPELTLNVLRKLDNREAEEALIQKFNAHCDTVLAARTKAAELYPEVRNFFKAVYGNKQKATPGVNEIRQFYANQAQLELIKQGKGPNIDELTFRKALDQRIDIAVGRNDYLPESAVIELPKPAAAKLPKKVDPALSEIHKQQIEAELGQLGEKIAEIRLVTINHFISMAPIQESCETQQTLVNRVANKLKLQEDSVDLQNELRREQKKLESAQGSMASYEMVLAEYRDYAVTLEEQRLTCELLLIDQNDNQVFSQKMAALEMLRETHQRAQQNPKLQELKEKVLLQKEIRGSIQDELTAQKKAREAVEARLDQMKKKP